ncbi:hypothetical protein CERSUDRAFT_118697 [Gelatoporia subvermispora B]|uniref:Uncharacterized protein n=1 Tax=Ceriporiopsis subvermispora (strain B) TaxID=914234 RepID=M2R355_CERS8|nr:hypothetical protein CERSUDRAFT_118697 [Gelatoporia subvermispora B]
MATAKADMAPAVPGGLAHDSDPYSQDLPEDLRRVHSRLHFPPSYVVVGVYRLFTDPKLYGPVWQKCHHGVVRGLTVGAVWAAATFHLQRKFVELFLMKSPRVTGLSKETILGIHLPFDLPTYATVFFLSTQITAIITFVLSRNLHIARDRAYAQTIVSRGKGPDFWHPYVEEWEHPPRPRKEGFIGRMMKGFLGQMIVKMALLPFHLVPLVGMSISAYFRSLGTAKYLHKPYYQAKGMTPDQVAVFIEERKWDYRTFGFAAALLERLPLIGLVFSVSNRVGAAMWAHDLEKRQHYVEAVKAGRAGSPRTSASH